MTAPSPPRPPGERPALRSVLPLSLVTALLAATAAGGAVALAPQSVRLPLAGGAGTAALLLTLAVAAALHARGSVKLLRHRLNAVSRDAGLLLQERARMAEEFALERGRLTEESVQERARIAAEYARERTRLAAESERERERLAAERDRTVAETAEERARLTERARQAEADRTAVLAVTANVAGRMQALATGTLADLRAMEERHADEDVLADLLHLDHRTAQAGRLADSVAVLAGARSGRRWARPIPMESILRGAMGRIGAYRRVRLHSSSESAVAGHAAEGVMHALAELLDNAANFSPPTAEVHVYVEEVPAGAIISVEDSGLVMSDVQLRRAERAVSGESADLSGLSGTRLGLAVVGRLARKHGLKVSFRPSARGGTGVLMLIPQDVLASTIPSAAPTTARARSYDNVRAPHDLDAEPTPTHEFPTDPPAAPNRATPSATSPAASSFSPSSNPSLSPSSGLSSNSSFSSSFSSSFNSEFGSDYGSEFGSGFGTSAADAEPPTVTTTPTTPTTPTDPSSPDALPRRRRGHSLAEAEARNRAADTSPRPERAARPADDASTGAVRFSSFRRAVRGTGGTSGVDQAFVQGTATGDESPTAMTGTPGTPEPVRDTPAPEVAVRQPELEPVREPEWGAVGGSAWEPEAVVPVQPVRETQWEPEPARGLAWEPESARGTAAAAWEPDPVRELAWEPVRDTRPGPDPAAPTVPPAPDPHTHPHLEGDPTP